MPTRILIVDDHPVMRRGLVYALEDDPDLEVVGQTADAEAAVARLDELAPDLAVVDVSLPGMNGLELVKQFAHLRPGLLVLIVARHDEALYAERALRAGARGYVSKLNAIDEIVRAVRRVLDGGIYLSEALKDHLLLRAATGASGPASFFESLSDRELEVFEMTGRGLPTREIADRLHLSMKTVESYRTRIKGKLGYESGTELIKHAIRWVEGEGAT